MGCRGQNFCRGRDGQYNKLMISAGNLLGEGSVCIHVSRESDTKWTRSTYRRTSNSLNFLR